MVRPLKRPIHLVAPNIREENRRFEISRFRKWYIHKFSSAPPPGFSNIRGHWASEPPPTNEVNAAVARFLRDGFRYPGYPFSNF